MLVLICNYEEQVSIILDWFWMGGGWVGEIRKGHTQMQGVCERELQTDKYRLIESSSDVEITPAFTWFFSSIYSKA